MDSQFDERLAEEISQIPQRYAGYFSARKCKDKTFEEREVARDLEAALARSGTPLFHNPRPNVVRPEQSPDCIADASDGSCLVGIEVTEIVSSEAIRRTISDEAVVAAWTLPTLIAAIQARLNHKDQTRSVVGGPYRQYCVVMQTDEPSIPDLNLNSLSIHSFGPFERVTHAFLLLSYSPVLRSCPVIALTLARPSED